MNFDVILIALEGDFLYLFLSRQRKKSCLRLLHRQFQKSLKMCYQRLKGCYLFENYKLNFCWGLDLSLNLGQMRINKLNCSCNLINCEQIFNHDWVFDMKLGMIKLKYPFQRLVTITKIYLAIVFPKLFDQMFSHIKNYHILKIRLIVCIYILKVICKLCGRIN